MSRFLITYSLVLGLIVTAGATASVASGSVAPLLLFLPVLLSIINRFRTEWRLGGTWLQNPILNVILLYYSFSVTTVMAIGGLFGARNLSELLSALLFLPLVGYLLGQALPRKKRAVPLPTVIATAPVLKTVSVVAEPFAAEEAPDEAEPLPPPLRFDGDRRQFLKIASTAGLGVFFWSIFTNKAQAAFFGSVPGPGTVALKDTTGVKIDPAVRQPTDGYKINQVDDASPAYYGYVNKDGDWFIMKEDSSGNFRYYKKKVGDGTFGPPDNEWDGRATLSPYDYFDAIF